MTPVLAPGPVAATKFTLSVAKAGAGTVGASDLLLACGSVCSQQYDDGRLVTLTATPASGWHFEGWGGGSCSGGVASCAITIRSAVNVTASFASDAASPASVDAIIAAMPANSWKALPSTQMKDACPPPYDYWNCEAIISAWSGAGYDDKRDRMFVYGGGHSDSWFNNMFAFDLATMRWSRLNEMAAGATGVMPGPGWYDMRFESCGFYPKGVSTVPDSVMKGNYIDPLKCATEPVLSLLDFQQPRSSHTYGMVVYDRLNDKYCYVGGGYYPSAQTSSQVTVCLDPVSRVWSRVADRPETVDGRGQAAPDRAGNIWYLTDAGGSISKFNPTANTWNRYGAINYDAGGGADIDRLRGFYYSLAPLAGGKHSLRRWDLASPGTYGLRNAPVEVQTTGDLPTDLGNRPGFVYTDDKDRFVAWGGGRDVYMFNPNTSQWTRQAATGDDPGAQKVQGTYGRFRYSATRKVFVLVNSTIQNVFIYKPPG